ncbi:MAG: sodium:calcium antiporter, partial [Clostridia bacterium]|nr:sodium:calcium antiporter [Clostridia bacterium]
VDVAELKKPVLFFFIAAVFYAVVAYTTGYFSRVIGIALLCVFAIYMFVVVHDAMKRRVDAENTEPAPEEKALPTWKALLFLVLGAAFIAFGADLLVDNGIIIAGRLGVPESVIALTFVALGTSLPELVTAITALVKKRSALSVGNIIGANLFNLVLVSGLATAIGPFRVPSSKMIGAYPASLAVDIPVMFAVMLIMTVPAIKTGKLKRWQGIILLIIYFAFILFQLSMN